jgi:hypothetical protein
MKELQWSEGADDVEEKMGEGRRSLDSENSTGARMRYDVMDGWMDGLHDNAGTLYCIQRQILTSDSYLCDAWSIRTSWWAPPLRPLSMQSVIGASVLMALLVTVYLRFCCFRCCETDRTLVASSRSAKTNIRILQCCDPKNIHAMCRSFPRCSVSIPLPAPRSSPYFSPSIISPNKSRPRPPFETPLHTSVRNSPTLYGLWVACCFSRVSAVNLVFHSCLSSFKPL